MDASKRALTIFSVAGFCPYLFLPWARKGYAEIWEILTMQTWHIDQRLLRRCRPSGSAMVMPNAYMANTPPNLPLSISLSTALFSRIRLLLMRLRSFSRTSNLLSATRMLKSRLLRHLKPKLYAWVSSFFVLARIDTLRLSRSPRLRKQRPGLMSSSKNFRLPSPISRMLVPSTSWLCVFFFYFFTILPWIYFLDWRCRPCTPSYRWGCWDHAKEG